MRIYVGQSALRGSIERYAARLNLLEVLAAPGRTPGKRRLSQWRGRVPESFVFSVVFSPRVASLDGGEEAARQLEHARATAELLGAAWYVVKTPPSVTPTEASRQRLAGLAGRLAGDGRKTAWEPRGLWTALQAERAAAAAGVVLVRDVTRDEAAEGPVAYCRIRALGAGASPTSGLVEQAARRLHGKSDVYVVIEGRGAVRVRGVLEEELSGI